MSAKPFDVAPLIERLRTRVVPSGILRKVGTRADYAAVTALRDFPAPCAYVVIASERGLQTKTGMSIPGQQNRLAQEVLVGLGVALAFRNHRGLEGDELRDALREGVGMVRDHMLGWTPPGASAQLQLEAGDLEDYDASTALWVDKWNTKHVIKPEISP